MINNNEIIPEHGDLNDEERKLEKKRLRREARREKYKRDLRIMFSRRIVVIGAIGLLIFILLAIFAGVLTPYDPNTSNYKAIFAPPSSEHLLGCDEFGRDLLTRLLYGARVSLIVGVLAVAIACVIGVTIGLCAAYFGGWIDLLIMRCMEAFSAIPRIMVSMALITIFGNTITDLAIVLGISTIPTYVRMTRATALSTKNSDYVQAAKMQGAKSGYVMFHHVLPNCISPIIIMLTRNVGSTILMEAGLSFLGVGITIPTASWGTMVSTGRNYLLSSPLLALAPSICVTLLVICLNSLGDGIRDALDPRLHGAD